MATNLTDWSSDILAHAKRATKPSIINAVRGAAIAFCEKTWLWTATLPAISVLADNQDYALADPTDTEIIVVDNVKYKENGADNDQFRRLDPISETQMDLNDSGSWLYRESPAPTNFWVDVVEKTLHLYPIPTVASTDGLLVKVVVRPSDTCSAVSDFLYQEHSKTITNGALADLFSQEVMDWSDLTNPVAFEHLLNKANLYDRWFKAGCNEAKFKKITGATKRPLSVRLQPFC